MKTTLPLLLVYLLSCNSNTNSTLSTNSIDKGVIENQQNPKIISIELQSLNLFITKSPTDSFMVVKEINEDEVTYEESNTNDEIKINSQGKNSMVINPGFIIVQVPKNSFVTCKLMSGNVTVHDLECKSVKVESMSGRVVVKNVTLDRGKFQSMSGVVSYMGKLNKGNIDLKSMSGTAAVYILKGSSSELELTSEQSSVFFNGEECRENKVSKIVGTKGASLKAYSISGEVDAYIE